VDDVAFSLYVLVEAGGMRGLKKASLGIAVGTAIAAVQLTAMMMLLPGISRDRTDFLDRIQWALSHGVLLNL
jgi:hypothetical protein